MTNYYVYDPHGNCLGIVQNDTSIQWRSVFDKSGKFEIHLIKYDSIYSKENIIVSDDDFSMGFIESIEYSKNEFILRGHLDNLDDFLNIKTFNLHNINQLKDLADVNIRGRNLYPQQTKNIDVPIEVSTTWKTLRYTFDELCPLYRCGYEMKYDEETNHYNLFIHKARFNDDVCFEDELGNVIIEQLLEDISNEKNFAYVAGEGEGSARKIVKVDLSNGKPKKELYVDAREIQRKWRDEQDIEHVYSEPEYIKLLENKGKAELSKHTPVHEYDVDVNEYSKTFQFGIHYKMGDIVLVKSKKLNFSGYFLVAETNKIKQSGEKLQIVFRYVGGVEDADMLSVR